MKLEMFHWKTIVMWMILLSYSVSEFMLALNYVSIVVRLIYLRGYQLSVFLPLLIKITLFVRKNIINLFFVRTSSYILVALGFLNQPKLLDGINKIRD